MSLNNEPSENNDKNLSVLETASTIGKSNSSYSLTTLFHARRGSELRYVTDKSESDRISAIRFIFSTEISPLSISFSNCYFFSFNK